MAYKAKSWCKIVGGLEILCVISGTIYDTIPSTATIVNTSEYGNQEYKPLNSTTKGRNWKARACSYACEYVWEGWCSYIGKSMWTFTGKYQMHTHRECGEMATKQKSLQRQVCQQSLMCTDQFAYRKGKFIKDTGLSSPLLWDRGVAWLY